MPQFLQVKDEATQKVHGELSSTRVQNSMPVSTTGVDYAGPIFVRMGTQCSKTIRKYYIAIIVCFVTNAVHIVVVTSSTTEAFNPALRRFIARRGKPKNNLHLQRHQNSRC